MEGRQEMAEIRWISAQELKQMENGKNVAVVILDCRPTDTQPVIYFYEKEMEKLQLFEIIKYWQKKRKKVFKKN
jgi:hypothetical protein